MKKNHVTGSLSKSGKKYRAFIRVTDKKNGKTRQIGKTLDVEYKKGNKREAEKKLRQLMESYENKVQIDHSIREFVAFLKWYVELHSQKFSLKTSENIEVF
ncbi:MAG: hypothetical protein GX299_10940 [Epulopiscium sp.]|nr:hypothetical protein [Candidatus Epulonipiscium sp.]